MKKYYYIIPIFITIISIIITFSSLGEYSIGYYIMNFFDIRIALMPITTIGLTLSLLLSLRYIKKTISKVNIIICAIMLLQILVLYIRNVALI